VKCCVFSEVRTEFLNIILTSFGFKGLIKEARSFMHVSFIQDGDRRFLEYNEERRGFLTK
jgi:hypothetical protein